jgi:alpha-tubulin suppressor-like RCC1 family protein
VFTTTSEYSFAVNPYRALITAFALMGFAACGRDTWQEPVTPPVVTYEIRVNPSEVKVERESFVFVAANVFFNTGVRVEGRKIEWAIGDQKVAYFSVLQDTLVSVWGVSEGTTTLTASSDALTKTITVSVTPPVAAAAYINPKYGAVLKGASRTLEVRVFTAKKTELRTPTISWTSSDPSVASVDQSGKVTGISYGTADITATIDTVAVKATVFVPTPFSAVTVGMFHSCALKPNGRVYCWGHNDQGQLGDGTTQDRYIPTLVTTSISFSSIYAGGYSTCGLTADGSAYCWGQNGLGNLGVDGPALVTSPSPVKGGLHFTNLAPGYNHICGLANGGRTYCWGTGRGAGAENTVAVRNTPTEIIGAPHFSGLTSGSAFSCGLTGDGVTYCWGQDAFGALGDSVPETGIGINSGRSEPQRVVGGYRFASIETRPSSNHICGINSQSVAFCWGEYVENDNAPSTSNCYTSSSMTGTYITRCTAYPIPVSGGLSFSQISPGFDGRCGVDSTKALYCWGTVWDSVGYKVYPTPRATPTEIKFATISAGRNVFCGISTIGNVYCWGLSGSYGMVGDYSNVPWLPPPLASGRYNVPEPSLIAAP